ncbi:MAG: response regulator [Acidobacteria bacterium]|nr:response regulator [Acidobacteriota bacterium]
MNILIVDDSRFLQLGIQKVLQQVGHSTILAADGEQAIKLAVDKRPDLILLDIMLPGVPGTSVLKTLKHNAITAAIPVVVLTGLTRLDEPKLRSEGADGYMKKTDLDLHGGGQALLRIVNSLVTKPSVSTAT